jgi:hypothetical protein
MLKIRKHVLVIFVAAFAVSFAGCKRNDQGEGPAEQTGKTIDRALERAAEETGRVMERAGEAIENYGEETKDAPPEKREKSDQKSTSSTGR